MQNTTKLNSNYAFIVAVINTILVYIYLFKFEEVSENNMFYYTIILLFVISIQLGFITYFDKSPTKKLFKTLTIIFSVICLLSFILTSMLSAYGSAFNH